MVHGKQRIYFNSKTNTDTQFNCQSVSPHHFYLRVTVANDCIRIYRNHAMRVVLENI